MFIKHKYGGKLGKVMGTDLSNWMGKLPTRVRNSTCVTELAIPGSHNSFTYSLTRNGPVGPDEEELVQRLGNSCLTGSITKYIIQRWARCQTSNCTEQLFLGVRYFDIRLGIVAGTDRMAILHGLYGLSVVQMMQEMKGFLSTHPLEVVILDFQHFYDFSNDNHVDLVALLVKQFGQLLCLPQEELTGLTLDVITRSGKQVIVIYPVEQALKLCHALWPRYLCPNPWANTLDVTYLETFLNKGLANRDSSVLFVSQAIVTPSIRTVAEHPFSTLKKTVGPCNNCMCNWIEHLATQKKPNIIMVDFVHQHSLPKQIIALNH